MPRPIRPEVSDLTLRDALYRVGPHIESYNENLDLISRDIKALEQYLTNSGIQVNAAVALDQWDWQQCGMHLDEPGAGQTYCDEQQIEWSTEKSGRWRLMYSLFRHVANHGYTRTEIEHKPLIETSAAIRIKAYKKLPELVEAVGKSVEISKGRVDLELESVLRRFNNDDITRF